METAQGRLGVRVGRAKGGLGRLIDPNLLLGKNIRRGSGGVENFADYFTDSDLPNDDLDSSSEVFSPLLTRNNPTGAKAFITKHSAPKVPDVLARAIVNRSASIPTSDKINTTVSPERRTSTKTTNDDERFRKPLPRQGVGHRQSIGVSPLVKSSERPAAVTSQTTFLDDVAVNRSGGRQVSSGTMDIERLRAGADPPSAENNRRSHLDRVIVNGGAMDGSLTRFTKKKVLGLSEQPKNIARLTFGNCSPEINRAGRKGSQRSPNRNKRTAAGSQPKVFAKEDSSSSDTDSSDAEKIKSEKTADRSFMSVLRGSASKSGVTSQSNSTVTGLDSKRALPLSGRNTRLAARRSPDSQSDSSSEMLLIRPITQNNLDEGSSCSSKFAANAVPLKRPTYSIDRGLLHQRSMLNASPREDTTTEETFRIRKINNVRADSNVKRNLVASGRKKEEATKSQEKKQSSATHHVSVPAEAFRGLEVSTAKRKLDASSLLKIVNKRLSNVRVGRSNDSESSSEDGSTPPAAKEVNSVRGRTGPTWSSPRKAAAELFGTRPSAAAVVASATAGSASKIRAARSSPSSSSSAAPSEDGQTEINTGRSSGKSRVATLQRQTSPASLKLNEELQRKRASVILALTNSDSPPVATKRAVAAGRRTMTHRPIESDTDSDEEKSETVNKVEKAAPLRRSPHKWESSQALPAHAAAKNRKNRDSSVAVMSQSSGVVNDLKKMSKGTAPGHVATKKDRENVNSSVSSGNTSKESIPIAAEKNKKTANSSILKLLSPGAVNTTKETSRSIMSPSGINSFAQLRQWRRELLKDSEKKRSKPTVAARTVTPPANKKISAPKQKPTQASRKVDGEPTVKSTSERNRAVPLPSEVAKKQPTKAKMVKEKANCAPRAPRRNVARAVRRKVTPSTSHSESSDEELTESAVGRAKMAATSGAGKENLAMRIAAALSFSSDDDSLIAAAKKIVPSGNFGLLRVVTEHNRRVAEVVKEIGKMGYESSLPRINKERAQESSSDEELPPSVNDDRSWTTNLSVNDRRRADQKRPNIRPSKPSSSSSDEAQTPPIETRRQDRPKVAPATTVGSMTTRTLPCSRSSTSDLHELPSDSEDTAIYVPGPLVESPVIETRGFVDLHSLKQKNVEPNVRLSPTLGKAARILLSQMKPCSVVMERLTMPRENMNLRSLSSKRKEKKNNDVSSSDSDMTLTNRDTTSRTGKEKLERMVIGSPGKSAWSLDPIIFTVRNHRESAPSSPKQSVKAATSRPRRKEHVTSGSTERAPSEGGARNLSPQTVKLPVTLERGGKAAKRKARTAFPREAKENSPEIASTFSWSSASVSVRSPTPPPTDGQLPLQRSGRVRRSPPVKVVSMVGDESGPECSPSKRARIARRMKAADALSSTLNEVQENSLITKPRIKNMEVSPRRPAAVPRVSPASDVPATPEREFSSASVTGSLDLANECESQYEEFMSEQYGFKVFNPLTQSETFLDCIKNRDEHVYMSVVPGSNSVRMSKPLQERFFSTGILKLEPNSSKDLCCVGSSTLVYWVLHGPAIVTLHETTFISRTGDCFYVPCGNVYKIENRNEFKVVDLVYFEQREIKIESGLSNSETTSFS